MKTRTKVRETVGYIECAFGELQGPKGRPFFRVRLVADQVEKLLDALDRCTRREGRLWFTLTSTHDKPQRLRLMQPATPAYENGAADIYLRGESVWISGGEGSCNLNFSGRVGAPLLMERLKAARQRMRRFLEIRVPSRARNLIEFIPDRNLEAAGSAEHERLAATGAAVAAATLAEDDFSDWE